MRAHSTSRDMPDRVESAFAVTHSRNSKPRSSCVHALDSSTGPARHLSPVRNAQTPPTLRNEVADFLVDIDGLPIVVRFLLKELLAEMQSNLVSKGADIHSLLSSTLEKMADRIRGSSLRSADSPEQPLAEVELISSGEPLVPLQAPVNETVLRVGPLELDLIDRRAKRGERQIALRPREFHLLKFMMQRNGKLLTRATFFKEVWHYKFVPESNLVDVHMGRLRRKLDGANETPMIRNVRGVGFVLGVAPLSQGSRTSSVEAVDRSAFRNGAPQSAEEALQ
jgi:DNA-binding response OmpR family regulator